MPIDVKFWLLKSDTRVVHNRTRYVHAWYPTPGFPPPSSIDCHLFFKASSQAAHLKTSLGKRRWKAAATSRQVIPQPGNESSCLVLSNAIP